MMPSSGLIAREAVPRYWPKRSSGVCRPRTLTTSPRPWTLVTMPGGGLKNFADGERGNDIAIAAYSDQQTVDNGKGQRKQDGEGRALSR